MPYVVESADVGMIQAGNSPSFALEPFSQFGTISKMRGQNLNGHNAVEAAIFGAINLARPPGTDGREDFVGP